MKNFIFLSLVVLAGSLFFALYKSPTIQLSNISDLVPAPPLPVITEVHAVYVTANTARHANMEEVIRLIKKTTGENSLNSVVIDVKDESGFQLDNKLKTLVKRLRFLGIFPYRSDIMLLIVNFTKFFTRNAGNFTPIIYNIL